MLCNIILSVVVKSCAVKLKTPKQSRKPPILPLPIRELRAQTVMKQRSDCFPTEILKVTKPLPMSLRQLIQATRSTACLPVENSTAGSVSAVYDLILKHRFYIVGALDLPIDYCLGGLKQSEFEDIEIVRSHPQAISQCSNYIAKHNFEAVPCANTAVAAKDIAKEKRLNVAAICPYKQLRNTA